MEPLSLSTGDLVHHVVTIGMDVFPQVEVPDELTRLNTFYEEAKRQCEELVDGLITVGTDFRMSKEFRRKEGVSGHSITSNTFVLANRGPVFIIPLLLPDPVGDTGLEASYPEQFDKLRALFFGALPRRSIMRVGLVRDLLFSTGQNRCHLLITDQKSFANADLVGGKTAFKYLDERHNHTIEIEPVSITKTTRLPVGANVHEATGYGVRVRLDVNNAKIQRALEEPDIQEVLERATSLWPEQLLEFLQELPKRRQP